MIWWLLGIVVGLAAVFGLAKSRFARPPRNGIPGQAIAPEESVEETLGASEVTQSGCRDRRN